MGHGAEPPDLRVRPPAVQACPRAVTVCQKGTPRMRSAGASRMSRRKPRALTRKAPSLHEGVQGAGEAGAGRHAPPPLPRLRAQDRARRHRRAPPAADAPRVDARADRALAPRALAEARAAGLRRGQHRAARAPSRAVPYRRRGRRVRPPRALLLHLRAHLVGEQALHARRRVVGRGGVRPARPLKSLQHRPQRAPRGLRPRAPVTTLPRRLSAPRRPMTDPTHQAAIDSVLREERVFPPPSEFSRHAHVPDRARYDALYQWSMHDPERLWREMAGRLRWMTPFSRVLDWQPPFAQGFVGGKLNIADNCLDRHLAGPRRNKAALVWEGEPGERRVLTYHALHREVCRFANVLKGLGVKAGDRVGIYLPMIPEAAIAMLACARIGATHSVVFGGFSAEALRDRMNDAEASVLVTAAAGWRR